MKDCKPWKYIVWGMIHGQNIFIKLYGTYKMRDAQLWIRRNAKYYDHMRIRERGIPPE